MNASERDASKARATAAMDAGEAVMEVMHLPWRRRRDAGTRNVHQAASVVRGREVDAPNAEWRYGGWAYRMREAGRGGPRILHPWITVHHGCTLAMDRRQIGMGESAWEGCRIGNT